MTRIAIAVFAAALALGCSNGNDGPPYACDRDEDCPYSDEIRPQCVETGACSLPRSGCDPVAQRCLFHCLDDAHCLGGETCEDSVCRLLCETDADCYEGWRCDAVPAGGDRTVNACVAPAIVE